MVQILLHLLLLSLPSIPQEESLSETKTVSVDVSVPTASNRRRMSLTEEQDSVLAVPLLEERSEKLMDRLAMWQLMVSIEKGGATESLQNPHRLSSFTKSKSKVTDDRDWMQVFCENIAEPLYVTHSPALQRSLF